MPHILDFHSTQHYWSASLSWTVTSTQDQATMQPLLKSFPLYLSSVIFEWCIISDCKPRLASIWKNSPTSQANLHNGPLENLTLSFGQRVKIEHSSFCLCSGVVVVKGLAIDGQKIFFLLLKLKNSVIAWQICCSEWLWRLEDRSWSLKGFSRKRTIHTSKPLSGKQYEDSSLVLFDFAILLGSGYLKQDATENFEMVLWIFISERRRRSLSSPCFKNYLRKDQSLSQSPMVLV